MLGGVRGCFGMLGDVRGCEGVLEGVGVLGVFKPSLRVTGDAEGPHMIGRERDLLRFDWLDFLARSRQFCS